AGAQFRRDELVPALRRSVHCRDRGPDPLRSVPGAHASGAALPPARGGDRRFPAAARAGRRTVLAFLAGRGRAQPRGGGEAAAQLRARSRGRPAVRRRGGETRRSDGTEHAVLLDAVTSHLLQHVDLRDGHPLPIATAAYTAPEQAAGDGADERSDLYSVGVLLFQLLSGRLPVSGATPQELLRAHREHATLRLRDIGRRVHPELEETVARLMAKDPAGRPESGDEAAVMLRAMAALAEATPLEDEVHQEPPVTLARLRPVAATPPQMLPPAVDPGL